MKPVKGCMPRVPAGTPPTRKIEVVLPGHLAWWLEEFAKQLAMKPDQLVAVILEYYYETWRAGYEKACAESGE